MSHRVVALVFEGVIPLELAIPSRIFAGASLEMPSARGYSFHVCCERPGLVMSSEGFAIAVSAGIESLSAADTIVLLGSSHSSGGIGAPSSDLLREASARGVRIVALSGGAAAAMDLCLAVVRDDHGVAVSNSLARRLFGSQRLVGQPPFIEIAVPNDAGRPLERTRVWIGNNLSRPLTVKSMAAHAHMSERNFARRFVAETGASPLQWLLHRRILLARELLEVSDLSIKQIAARAGFGSTMAFRDQFKRRTGGTPVAYRDAFRLQHPNVGERSKPNAA